jgi:D-xylose transport system substrate-binding protein
MTFKRMQRVVITIVLVLLIVSCKDSDKMLIGFMVPNYQEARYAIDRDNFVKRAQELGAEVIVANAENDDNKQIAQASEMINKGVKAIVIIAVNQVTAAAISREGVKNNVKIVAYERLIQNCVLDLFISFDHFMAGSQMAEYALQHVPSGNYVIISGDKTDKNAELIMKGYETVLSPALSASKVKVVFSTYIEEWSPDEAYITMRKVLNYFTDPINVVLCANDGMAGGVIRALEEKGLSGKVLVTGMDAELAACRRIVEGTQNITIYKPMTKQGQTAAEYTIKLIKGDKLEGNITSVNNGKMDVPTIMLKPMVVDVKNIKETIIADGFHSEQEIYSGATSAK